MPRHTESELSYDVDLGSTLRSLADVSASDSLFVSCYLDMRGGKRACQSFLHRKVAHIRGSLRGLERFEFDGAAEMIKRALDSDWRPGAQGMVIFARGVSNDRYLSVLHSAIPLDNRLVRHPLPEILPLIALNQREPAFAVLQVSADGMRLFERRPGSLVGPELIDETPWMKGIDPLDGQSFEDDAGRDLSGPPKEAIWRLHKALTTSSLPLLIAGDRAALAEIADWLPPRAIERLVGSLPVSLDIGREALLLSARDRIRAICRAESDRLAGGLAMSAMSQGSAVVGYRSTLQAIRHREVAAVVIADWDHPGLGLPWDAVIEICYEAVRAGARIVLADSVPLREAGGVGCLLHSQSGREATSNRDRLTGFQQVA